MKWIYKKIKAFFTIICFHCGHDATRYGTGYYFKHSAFGAVVCAKCHKRIG